MNWNSLDLPRTVFEYITWKYYKSHSVASMVSFNGKSRNLVLGNLLVMNNSWSTILVLEGEDICIKFSFEIREKPEALDGYGP